jgi:hypothetical protein
MEKKTTINGDPIEIGTPLNEKQVMMIHDTIFSLLSIIYSLKKRRIRDGWITAIVYIVLLSSLAFLSTSKINQLEKENLDLKNKVIHYRMDSVMYAKQMQHIVEWKEVKHDRPEEIKSYIRKTKKMRLKYDMASI